MKIGTARESYDRKPFLKIALTGASGAGKTDWAARSPRPLILLTEVQAFPSIVVANPEAVCVQIEKWQDFREAWAAITTGRPCEIEAETGEVQPALAVKLGGQEFTIQTVIVDTMTDLQRLMFASMIGADAGRIDRLDFATASNNLSIDKHGILIAAAEEIFRQQRAIPCNTIFLTLSTQKEDDTGARQTLPMLTGSKLPYAMGQYFNAAGLAQVRRTDNGGIQHVIRWVSPSAAAICKPGPGWPATITNSRTAGETTLGSLLRFTFPDLPVAACATDSASFVTASATPAAEPIPVSFSAPAAQPVAVASPSRPRRA
jgi:hypothetical protein